MDNNFRIVIDKFTCVYAPVLGVLTIAGIIGRFLEIMIVSIRHGIGIYDESVLLIALTMDLQLILMVSLPLALIFYLLKKAGLTSGTIVIASIAGLTISVWLLLSLYFSSTLTPLGPEFWAYSMSEMTDTVLAAESHIELKLALFSLLVLFFINLLYRVAKWLSSFSYQTRVGFTGAFASTAILLSTLTLFQSENSDHLASNKLFYFVQSGIEINTETAADYEPLNNSEFPFLKRATQEDVLGPYFEDISEPPNIVFVLVESLGGEFVGKNGQWVGFAPFIDSLAENGLYWENGLSLSGRTFGMVPSLFGSLPPGNNGFMDLGPEYPDHTSLIRILGDQGYHTSFYSGYNTYFDGLNYFLDYQGIDFIMNSEWISDEFGDSYDTGGNYWGYDDKSLFEIANALSDTVSVFPRLEIYHTLQSHSPFTVPDEEAYRQRFDEHLRDLSASASKKESFERYRSELTTLLFADDAVRAFFNEYKKREQYSNTIFVITGDHWLIPVPQTSKISRYHVPIIIYSDLIREPIRFESVNSHANIVPALTSFLENSANLSLPDSVHWIGDTMDTTRIFRNIHSIPLMQNKNQLSDYISGSYYLNNNTLYQVGNELNLTEVSNSQKKNELLGELNLLKSKNSYAINNNRLYPDILNNDQMSGYEFITEYSAMFDKIDASGLSVDEQFRMAREYAFDGDYDRARSIAKRLLLEVPNYHDVRILLGRTYAWNGEYEKARENLKDVIRRDQNYYDTYNALSDAEYWAGNYVEALNVINQGLSFHPENELFLEKKIKFLLALERTADARITYSELRGINPAHESLDQLESQLF